MVAVLESVTAAHVNAVSRKPVCRLIQQAAQPFANNTEAAFTFGAGSEDLDTHGMHDEVTNNTRITPTVAGVYRLHGSGIFVAVASVTYDLLVGRFFKNGAAQPPILRGGGPRVQNTAASFAMPSAEFQANGTTDYFEFFGTQICSTTASRNTNVGGSFASTFSAEWIRELP